MKGTSSLMPSVSSGWWRNATVPASVHHQSRGTPASGGSATIEGAVTVLHPRHLDRRRVHELSRQIDATYVDHDRAVQALLVRHARLTCFVRDSLPASPQDDEARGVAVAFLGVVLRIVDLVGGTVREVRSKDLRDARRRVAERAAGGDQGAEGLVARARSVTRAQPHLLDEILHVLVEATPADSLLTDHDRRRVYALLWIAVEAIDARWTPPATIQSNRTTTETYVQVDLDGTESWGPYLESIQALTVTKNATANLWWEAVVTWTNDGVNPNTPFTGLCGAGITADGQAIQTAVTSGFGGRIMKFAIGVKNASGSALESGLIWVWLVMTFKT